MLTIAGFCLLVARALLSMVFGVAGIAKLRDRDGFRAAVSAFGISDRAAGAVAVTLPPAELAIAVLLLTPLALPAAAGALALLAAFTVAIAANLVRGKAPECRCFGQLQSTPIGTSTLARNAALLASAAFVAAQRPAGALPAILVAFVLVGTALALGTRLGGRIRVVAPVAPMDPIRLPVGARAPEFQLERADGGTLSLEQLRADGLPLMLIFSAPRCGACAEFLPTAGEWETDFASRMRIAVITGASPDGSHAAGPSIVLHELDHEIADSFGVPATPAALLVNPDGTIASGLMIGGQAIATLLPGKPPVVGTTRRDAIKYTVAAAGAGSLMAACAGLLDPCDSNCKGDNGTCYSCSGGSSCSRSGGTGCGAVTSGVACCSGGGGNTGSCNCRSGYVYNYSSGQCCDSAHPYYYPGTHGGSAGCYASCPYVGDCGTTYQHC